MRKLNSSWLIYGTTLMVALSVNGCSLLSSKQVAVACPEFPPVPEVVAQRSASQDPNLLKEWETLMDSFVLDLQKALDAYNRALSESFSGAKVNPLSPVSAQGGQ